MEALYRSARRVGSGRTALSILAGVFLAASLLFWGVLHWTVFVSDGAGVTQIAITLVTTIIHAFARSAGRCHQRPLGG